MLVSPHAATGAAIGALVVSPLAAIPLAVASHYALDLVPHWQETLAPYTPTRKTYLRVPIDVALAIVCVWLIYHWHQPHQSIVWIAALAATLPDLDSLLVLKPKLLDSKLVKPYWSWHCRIQRETKSLAGLLPQLAVMAAALLAAYLSR